MAVEARHLNANLRFKDADNDTTLSLHRIHPNIESAQVTQLSEAFQQVRGSTISNISMTVTTELLGS